MNFSRPRNGRKTKTRVKPETEMTNLNPRSRYPLVFFIIDWRDYLIVLIKFVYMSVIVTSLPGSLPDCCHFL